VLTGCPAAGATNLTGCSVATGATGPIVVTVPIAVGAAAGGGTVTNTANASGGGDPLCTVATPCSGSVGPTPVSAAVGQLSGRVWLDRIRDGIWSGNPATEPTLAGVVIRIYNSAGTLVDTQTTSAAGTYTSIPLPPGSGYKAVFDYGNNIQGLVAPQNVNPSLNGVPSPIPGSSFYQIENITLVAGNNTIDQNARIVDPTGVVYDSILRTPIPGAIVVLIGPNGLPVPNSQLVPATPNNQPTGANGAYVFFINGTAPTGTYRIQVTAPSGYSPPNATLGGVAPPQAPFVVPPFPGTVFVQPQVNAPPVGVNGAAPVGMGAPGAAGTQYVFQLLNFGPTSQDVVNNHIPLDRSGVATFAIEKLADKSTAEIGDSVLYRIRILNSNAVNLPLTQVVDSLPIGFRVIPGTVTLQLTSAAPVTAVPDATITGFPGPNLVFPIGTVVANSQATLTYRVRIGIGADKGTGTNTAFAQSGGLRSASARVTVRVTGGVFTTDACVVGKVFVDCNQNKVQDAGEPGIPGVRLYMEDGTSITTDENGQYSLCGIRPITHVIKIDPTTAPVGSRFGLTSSRNVGDGESLFIDAKNGQLSQADFLEQSCFPKIMQQIEERKKRGPPYLLQRQDTQIEQKGIQFNSDKNRIDRGPGGGSSIGSGQPPGGQR
jgi:uncharacterized repeat protein (TIGR01451 family)